MSKGKMHGCFPAAQELYLWSSISALHLNFKALKFYQILTKFPISWQEEVVWRHITARNNSCCFLVREGMGKLQRQAKGLRKLRNLKTLYCETLDTHALKRYCRIIASLQWLCRLLGRRDTHDDDFGKHVKD